jgi:hypothetical protein
VQSRERVVVGLDATGRPHRVRAVQRISLTGLGDYTFAVPAPVADVSPTPDSDSQPGLRAGQILWAGFSPGRKVLGSDALLRTRPAAALLPLRIGLASSVAPSGALQVELTVANATGAQVQTFTAEAEALTAARALDLLRASAARGVPTTSRLVTVRGRVLPKTETVSAPFRVTGTLSFARGTLRIASAVGATAVGRNAVSFHGILGGGRAMTLRVAVAGTAMRAASPTLRVVATPLRNDPLVRPPGQSWVAAVRNHRLKLSGRALLARAITLDLGYARARQYTTFLWNPDPTAASRTTYVFRTERVTSAAAPPAPAPAGGHGVLLIVAVVAGGLLLAAALVIVWAHL